MEAVPVFVFKQDEVHRGIARFFNHDMFSDLVLVAPDGRRLKCHRVLLAACSEPFAAALATSSRPGEDLPVTGVDSDALEAVVRFFYEGRLLLSTRNAIAVLDAAQRLKVACVAEAARGYVRSVRSSRTAMALLVEALRYDMEELAEECLASVVVNFEEVAYAPDFLAAPFPTAARVLRAAKASGVRSSCTLFTAAWRWLTWETAHVQHLEEVLCLVASPDLSIQDLLGVASITRTASDENNGGVGGGSRENGAATEAALQQLLSGQLGQMLLGGGIAQQRLQALNMQMLAASWPLTQQQQQQQQQQGSVQQSGLPQMLAALLQGSSNDAAAPPGLAALLAARRQAVTTPNLPTALRLAASMTPQAQLHMQLQAQPQQLLLRLQAQQLQAQQLQAQQRSHQLQSQPTPQSQAQPQVQQQLFKLYKRPQPPEQQPQPQRLPLQLQQEQQKKPAKLQNLTSLPAPLQPVSRPKEKQSKGANSLSRKLGTINAAAAVLENSAAPIMEATCASAAALMATGGSAAVLLAAVEPATASSALPEQRGSALSPSDQAGTDGGADAETGEAAGADATAARAGAGAGSGAGAAAAAAAGGGAEAGAGAGTEAADDSAGPGRAQQGTDSAVGAGVNMGVLLAPSHPGNNNNNNNNSSSSYPMFWQRNQSRSGVCQVDSCYCDLTGFRDYHQRYRICEYHLKVASLMRDDKPQRFCQQCGRFHPLSLFDGNKRSCRNRLQKHNARRRKRDFSSHRSGPGGAKRRRGGAGHAPIAAACGSSDSDEGDGEGEGEPAGRRGQARFAANPGGTGLRHDPSPLPVVQGFLGNGAAVVAARAAGTCWGLDALAEAASGGAGAGPWLGGLWPVPRRAAGGAAAAEMGLQDPEHPLSGNGADGTGGSGSALAGTGGAGGSGRAPVGGHRWAGGEDVAMDVGVSGGARDGSGAAGGAPPANSDSRRGPLGRPEEAGRAAAAECGAAPFAVPEDQAEPGMARAPQLLCWIKIEEGMERMEGREPVVLVHPEEVERPKFCGGPPQQGSSSDTKQHVGAAGAERSPSSSVMSIKPFDF